MEDLRKHTRHKILVPAEADTSENTAPVSVVEISVEGMRLQSQKFFSPGTLMSVSIKLGRSIVFSGWVIWALDKYLPEGHVYHTGIQTESVTDSDIGILGINQREALVQEIIKLDKK